MKLPSEDKARAAIAERLAELLEVDRGEVRFEAGRDAGLAGGKVAVGAHAFAVAWRSSGRLAQVAAAIEQASQRAAVEAAVPLVAVPFMGRAGRERCAKTGVAWLDLSGNAGIVAAGLRILVEGRPNRFKRRGRPQSVFAPKSSRIARWLLIHHDEALTQRQIARATGVGEGYTSKIVRRLQRDGLVVREGDGGVRPRDRDLLLAAWREAYDFERHHIIRGHVAARSGAALLRHLADSLRGAVGYAATGLGAAWLLKRFAGFRLASVYLAEEPPPRLLEAISFREQERGANCWLVVPADAGVFQGLVEVDGVRCVHPLQVYLDLAGHPERAAEAADELRGSGLIWGNDG